MSLRQFRKDERKRMKEPVFTVNEIKPTEEPEKKHNPLGTGSKRKKKRKFISIEQKLKHQAFYQIFPVDDHTMKIVQHDPRTLQKYK